MENEERNVKKVILIHGYNTNPYSKKWQITAEALKAMGVECSAPVLPGGERPHSQEWLEIIDKEVKDSKGPVILCGSSLGTRAILLYLDKYNQKVDSVILIASFNNNFQENRKRRNGAYADFFDYALDIERIKKLANHFIVVHSKDDELINYNQAAEISNQLGAKLITYENMGHFCGERNSEKNAAVFIEIIKSVL
ncbi:MAG: YqiA/YcfP family alpha/beta fold hydrolase [Candidatus Staskawiczbacteria bacterium]|jgi:hypothetical protein